MCRLFGMTGGSHRVAATFWLLDAEDSLTRQSRRNPDGTGLGYFEGGCPRVDKWPLAAYEDGDFAREARSVDSTTFVAHVRYATTGGLDARNTHPFRAERRVFAHNGVVGELDRLEAELGRYRDMVGGDTDSERLFALITRRIDEAGGEVAAGIAAACRWVAANLPVLSLNLVLATETDLWALRFPATRGLFLLERQGGGRRGRHFEGATAAGTVRVRSGDLARRPAVIVASEPMDENPDWREIAPGELMHVGSGLAVESTIALEGDPAYPLTESDLEASPRPGGGGG